MEFESKMKWMKLKNLQLILDNFYCKVGWHYSIFYLMSRGLNEKQAKNILIKGFLSDAVETITNILK